MLRRTVINHATIFDGSGQKPFQGSVVVKGRHIVEVAQGLIAPGPDDVVINGNGKWLTPGFLDIHTHYDAEVEFAPGLTESLRHGVTTVFMGSCSLSAAVGDPVDIADMFARVEAIPRDILLNLFQEVKDWSTPGEYVEHLNQLPLGPNVACFMGHSAIRAEVMGLQRSLTGEKPSAAELLAMNGILEDGLTHGFLGLSFNSLSWDKMDGPRFRSHCLPSTYAKFSEYRRLSQTLRKWGRVLQAVPNVSTKYEIFIYGLMSAGWGRSKLKTTLVALMDLKGDRKIHWIIKRITELINRLLRADFRLQALPEVFDLWADGIDLVVFEEFGAGAMALHLEDEQERRRLLKDQRYQRRFRRQWKNPLIPKAFHRNFRFSEVKSCPDQSLVGRSFNDIAADEGSDPADVFLDLVSRYGKDLRWYTVMANDRPAVLHDNMKFPGALIGFSDAGAHLRNMAHYNFPLQALKQVVDAEKAGEAFMPLEQAVWRLTGELADWFGVDAGRIAVGREADLVLIDPEGLNDRVLEFHEEPLPGYPQHRRLVRRNDRAVEAVFVGGELAVKSGKPLAEVGVDRKFGRFLACRDDGLSRSLC